MAGVARAVISSHNLSKSEISSLVYLRDFDDCCCTYKMGLLRFRYQQVAGSSPAAGSSTQPTPPLSVSPRQSQMSASTSSSTRSCGGTCKALRWDSLVALDRTTGAAAGRGTAARPPA